MIQLAKEFIRVSQFAKKQKLSRQRVYKLIEEKRINPEPVTIGEVLFVNKNAKIQSCNSLTDAVLRQSDYLKKHPKHKVFVEPKKIIK